MAVLCIVLLLAVVLLLLTERKQDKKLILELQSRLASGGNPSPVKPEEKEKKVYTYLALGNSITLHGKCSYWWDDRRGMAASDVDKDYVHLFVEHLKKIHGKVDFSVFNFSVWEVQAHDRAELLPLLDKYLAVQPDLITVQLSENVQDQTTFKGDFREMIQYIHEKVPQAKIMIIGEFWVPEKDEAKRAAAAEFAYPYISMLNLLKDKENCCPIGTLVKDDQGNDHAVDHEGVAGHPGDRGMKYIADSLIEAYSGK